MKLVPHGIHFTMMRKIFILEVNFFLELFFFISVEIKKGIKIALKCSQLHAFLFSSVKVLYSKEYFRDKSRNHEAENLK